MPCTYLHAYVRACVYLRVGVRVHATVRMWVCGSVHMCVSVCLDVCVSLCLDVCVSVCAAGTALPCCTTTPWERRRRMIRMLRYTRGCLRPVRHSAFISPAWTNAKLRPTIPMRCAVVSACGSPYSCGKRAPRVSPNQTHAINARVHVAVSRHSCTIRRTEHTTCCPCNLQWCELSNQHVLHHAPPASVQRLAAGYTLSTQCVLYATDINRLVGCA